MDAVKRLFGVSIGQNLPSLRQISRSFFSGPAFRRTFRQARCQMVPETLSLEPDFRRKTASNPSLTNSKSLTSLGPSVPDLGLNLARWSFGEVVFAETR
jgi:hypothetical protein